MKKKMNNSKWETHKQESQKQCWAQPDFFCMEHLVFTYLTFWRRISFQILAHPVFKMWVIQKPNKVALWNKRHFEENKMDIIQHV